MRRFGCVVLVAALGIVRLSGSDRLLKLPIGDPARKDREARVVLDAITDTATGEVLTPAALVARLDGVRFLLVGETHTAIDFHRVQLRVIQGLHEAGRRILIGLEMYPYTEQRWLDAWRERLVTEDGFVSLSRWYRSWSYPWGYYRDIFLYARDNRLPMYAINTPREVVTAVRKKGFANLTPEEAAHVPPQVDTDHPEHMTMFKASFEADDALHRGMTEDAWKGMLAAQATWDASMGYNAVKVLERPEHRDAILVVLVGSGHVGYGLGIERQARRWFSSRIASLIPVPVATFRDGRAEPVASVQASYANYIWGVPGEGAPLFPPLGISTRVAGEGQLQIINVERDSAAKRAGLQINDVLVSIDGVPVTEQEAMHRIAAAKRWGDTATFVVRRGHELMTIVLEFRRSSDKAGGEP